MSDTAEMPHLPASELMIVPWPHRDDAWAVTNRHGDTLATGDYRHCLRHLHRLTSPR